MKQRRKIICVLSVWATLTTVALAQTPEATDQPRSTGLNAGGQGQASVQNGGRLPAWLKLGGELRGRAEFGKAFDSVANTPSYLSRLRLTVSAEPMPWVRIVFQGQDARAFRVGADENREDQQNTFDVRQAYVDFGSAEEGWRLRVGRQELAFGDERLVGADSYWDCFGQGFDAVRLSFAATKFRIDTFAGFRVHPARRRLDPFDTSNRITGLSAQFKAMGDSVLEPYFLWKRGEDTFDLAQNPGHRDVLTSGIRSQRALPLGMDYNIEMALQSGHVVADRIAAWAGHWELGWKPLAKEFGLRLGLEYNFASGDKSPSDREHGTFDDLYPAGFSKFGTVDPIAWRNIQYPAIVAEVPITMRWTVYAGYRRYWLANIHDGLYPGGDQYLVRNPAATSSEVGSQALVSVAYARSEHWRLFAGYGYLFPGAFLSQSGYPTALRMAYVLSSFAF